MIRINLPIDVLTSFLVLSLLLFTGLQLNAQDDQIPSSTDSILVEKLEAIPLVDINYELERTKKKLKKMETGLAPDIRITEIRSDYEKFKTFLEREAREFESYNPYNLSKFFLENTYRLWEGYYAKITGWRAEINSKLKSIENNLEELEKSEELWELTLNSENIRDEPRELKERLRSVIQETNQYQENYTEIKRQYILLEDDLSDLSAFCDGIISNVVNLQQNLRDSLFVAVAPPIWDIGLDRSDYTPVRNRFSKFIHESAKTIRYYFRINSLRSFVFWILLVILGFIWLRRSYLKGPFDDSMPGHKNVTRIFSKYPWLVLVSIVLGMFHLSYPYYPLLLNHILTLILLINMRFILAEFISKVDKRFIFSLILLLIINDLEIVFWYFGRLGNYYILFETILGIVLMVPGLSQLHWTKFKTDSTLNKARYLLTLFILIFYSVSFIANAVGYIDLAVLLLKVGIHVPEFTVVYFGFYKIGSALIVSLVRLGQKKKTTWMTDYWDRIKKRALQILGILFIYYWFFSFTVSLEVSRVFGEAIVEFLMVERQIGTSTITIGSLLAFILILLSTFLITGIIKVLFTNVVIKRSNLPRGVPAAISATIRYFLVILGFVFALSAAGIELGKFSLLAGALGVGIGFGLQNIVNNFISGLIIIYERPIQVGDTIEVGSLLGQVHHIGIRSSNVKTYDGSEVVVPNGNLISNELINWTLSDNQRRIEIKVGTAYGSDPNEVVEVLEKVARDNENVLKEPAPWALFEEFGDSSLNFRLLFWVPYNIGIGTKSKVAIGIFNAFKENGIEIPFPQMDLHVKDPGPGKEDGKEVNP